MRKLVLLIAAVTSGALIVGFYPGWVEKPARTATGPVAVRMDAGVPAPEYHSPLPWWQTHHMDVVNRGDLAEADCLHCHAPEKSCNNCHAYVGVKEIQSLVNTGH